MRELARKRKEEDPDFEEKRMNMRVPTPSPPTSPPKPEPEEFGVGPVPRGPPGPPGGVPVRPGPPGGPSESLRTAYPPDRIAVSERGIPYHEERVHGDPYDEGYGGPEYVKFFASTSSYLLLRSRGSWRVFSKI